jgi:hypothetical protein
MNGFNRFSEVDLSILGPKSDDDVILFSRLDDAEFVVGMEEKKKFKDYRKAVNGLNGHLCKKVVDKELDSLDRARTCNIVDRIEEGKEVVINGYLR